MDLESFRLIIGESCNLTKNGNDCVLEVSKKVLFSSLMMHARLLKGSCLFDGLYELLDLQEVNEAVLIEEYQTNFDEYTELETLSLTILNTSGYPELMTAFFYVAGYIYEKKKSELDCLSEIIGYQFEHLDNEIFENYFDFFLQLAALINRMLTKVDIAKITPIGTEYINTLKKSLIPLCVFNCCKYDLTDENGEKVAVKVRLND
jgi:hypothetical protein